jgi:hypothetical protein
MTNAALSAPLTPTGVGPLNTDHTRLIHRLLWRLYGIQPGAVLNGGAPVGPPSSGAPLAAELHRLAKALRATAYEAATGRMDYASLAGSALLSEYRRCAQRLAAFDPAALTTTAERLAFWINLYNALTIDAVITLGVRQSVQEIKGFFWRAAYNIGGRRYSAHDIEHGVLRANAPHPAIPGPHFARGDPRRQHSLERLDPRIHFALVCGARACPPIAVYDSGQIDAQLDLAARSFINGGGVTLDQRGRVIWLSKIFQWYAPDFGAAPLALARRQPLLNVIAPYMDDAESQAVVRTGRWRVRFPPYDWRLNG